MLSPVDEIKNRLDVVDVIQSYIKLTKAGANYKALCPFHKEKTPSFVVSPERQIWHCFGCGKGGDIFRFVMEIENVEFRDALKMLADKAGIELRHEDPKVRSQRQRILEINEAATQFFESNLSSNQAQQVRDYLKKRGLQDKTIRQYRLGYALDEWRSLERYLKEKGFFQQDIVASGLVIHKEANSTQRSTSYDRFRSRIMFPVRNLLGEVIGFSGRIFSADGKTGETAAKYINSPNNLVYNKSKTLYGLFEAREAIRKSKFVILVEGNLDVLMSHQIGIKNVVATCGTALNAEHLNILKRYGKQLKLCFDQDQAGSAATKRAIKEALSLDFALKIIAFPKEKDPADLVLKNPEEWKKLAKSGVEVMQYLFSQALHAYPDKSPTDKKAIAKELLPFIKALANNIEQAHWINKLAEELDIDEKYLYEALIKTKQAIGSYTDADLSPKRVVKTRRQILEEGVMIVLLKKPDFLKKYSKELRKNVFSIEKLQEAFKEFSKNPLSKKAYTNETLNYLFLKAGSTEIDADEIDNEMNNLLTEIKKDNLKKQLRKALKLLKEAEKKHDKSQLQKLLKNCQDLSKKLESLS